MKTEGKGNMQVEGRAIGEVYNQIAARYLEIAGVSRSKTEDAVAAIIARSKHKVKMESLVDVESTLRIRPYIEAVLSAIDDAAERLALDWRLPRDYLAHLLYGQALEAHKEVAVSISNAASIALKAIEALHQELMKDIAYEFLANVPAAQVFALPFALVGEQHVSRLLRFVEPIFDDLNIRVLPNMLAESYSHHVSIMAPQFLRKGQEIARGRQQASGATSDYECLILALLATPTQNKKFDRFIQADKRIMTEASTRLAKAQRVVEGMAQQAIALTPKLGVGLPQ